jgi:hypothetical protein
MGVGDKMRVFASGAQESVKSTSISLLHFGLRFITGLLLGLVLALIGQELLGYGMLALLFVMVVVLAMNLKILANWSMGQILIFDLICVLVGMLLRMYILVAP